MMRKTIFILMLLAGGNCLAQLGTAPSGYYPLGYGGSTFTGVVTARDAATQEIRLTYENKKKNKSENFVGLLQGPCELPTGAKTTRELKVEDFPDGTALTAFYNTKSHKEDGKKVEVHQIIMMRFDELDGKPVPEQQRIPIYCMGNSKKK